MKHPATVRTMRTVLLLLLMAAILSVMALGLATAVNEVRHKDCVTVKATGEQICDGSLNSH